MTDDVHSRQLVWLADRCRAQAALGLHYYPSDADRDRFAQVRRHAAALAALTDTREAATIERCFARDTGLRTPLAAVAFHITTAEGDRIWRTAYVHPDQQLPDAVALAADLLGATAPIQLRALTDSHALGLPDPHTHLVVYAASSARPVDDLADIWPEPATAIQAAVRTHTLEDLPRPTLTDARQFIVVSADAAVICRDIATLAADGAQATTDPYNIARFTHLRDLATSVTAQPVTYTPHAPDLNPVAAATGAEVAIRDSAGRLLLIQRSDTGQWAMPGGACEVGEPWAHTAVRETREEIGLVLDPAALRLVDVFDNRAITTELTTIPVIAVFNVHVDHASVRPATSGEVDATAWVTPAELETLDLFPGHRIKAAAACNGTTVPVAAVRA